MVTVEELLLFKLVELVGKTFSKLIVLSWVVLKYILPTEKELAFPVRV